MSVWDCGKIKKVCVPLCLPREIIELFYRGVSVANY